MFPGCVNGATAPVELARLHVLFVNRFGPPNQPSDDTGVTTAYMVFVAPGNRLEVECRSRVAENVPSIKDLATLSTPDAPFLQLLEDRLE